MNELSQQPTDATSPPGAGLPRMAAATVAAAALTGEVGVRMAASSGPELDYLRFAGLVLGAALLFTIGGIFMKLSEGATRFTPSLAMAACFVAGAILQAFAMRGGELGMVYVIVLGVEAVLAMTFGWYFFAEQMSPWKVGGAVLIVAGIATLRAGL